METSNEIEEIAKALNLMQSELGTVSKENSGYNYKYADYASIWNMLRAPLTENGLSILQNAVSCNGGVSVTTRVLHESGQWIQFGPLLIPMDKPTAHNTGSAITYARRYGLSAALGIVPDDDDGASAQKAAPEVVPEAPTIAPFTDEQIDEWVELWSHKYDIRDLQGYCQARAKNFKHSINQTCAELDLHSASKIISNVDTWLRQQKPDVDSHQEEGEDNQE